MSWTLFPKHEPPSETARYTVEYVEFHPCVRPDRLPTKTITVRGYRARGTTVAAVKAAGGRVLGVTQRGR